jgi:hypothetical protein
LIATIAEPGDLCAACVAQIKAANPIPKINGAGSCSTLSRKRAGEGHFKALVDNAQISCRTMAITHLHAKRG